jgi:5-methylcytosine-specific restriction endonuclease McrA
MFDPLPFKQLELNDHMRRVMFFDPREIIKRVKIDHNLRNPSFSVIQAFPSNGNKCACGCGAELVGRRKRWATKECHDFATTIQLIFMCYPNTISKYLRKYYGYNCIECGCEDKSHGEVSWIKVDHIIPVKHGGGGGWLSNYQLLCHDCHVKKTKEDFGWGNPKPKKHSEQPKLFNL